jgi:phosphoribosylformylglycinamidine (FGAM) synthase PurS component
MKYKNLSKMFNFLNPEQVKYLDLFLSNNLSKSDKNPMFIMFQLLNENKQLDDAQVCKRIYDKAYCSAYSQLKAKLEKILISAILLNEGKSISKNVEFNERFEIVKQILIAELFIRKTEMELAIEILEKLLQQASSKEYIIEMVLINNLLLQAKSRNESFSELEEMYQKSGETLSEFLEYNTIVNQGAKLRSVVHSIKSQKKIVEKVQEVEMKMNEVLSTKNESNLFINKKEKLMLEMAVCKSKNNFMESLAVAKKLNQLYNQNISKISQADYFNLYIEKSISYLNLSSFQKCIENANLALKYNISKINELAVMEILFLAYFRDNDIENAKTILDKTFANPIIGNTGTMKAKFHFYMACYYYNVKKINQVNKHLNQAYPLFQDKKGWEIALRLLDIMIYIDRKDFYYLNIYLLKVKNVMKKMKNENMLRLIEIMKVVNAICKYNGNKKMVLKAVSSSIKKLNEAKGEYYWSQNSYEFYRFDEWIKDKLIE